MHAVAAPLLVGLCNNYTENNYWFVLFYRNGRFFMEQKNKDNLCHKIRNMSIKTAAVFLCFSFIYFFIFIFFLRSLKSMCVSRCKGGARGLNACQNVEFKEEMLFRIDADKKSGMAEE
jgi:hypothetical protein